MFVLFCTVEGERAAHYTWTLKEQSVWLLLFGAIYKCKRNNTQTEPTLTASPTSSSPHPTGRTKPGEPQGNGEPKTGRSWGGYIPGKQLHLGQNELGLPSFSANFPKRVLFVPCVYLRGLNIAPFSPQWGEQVVLLAVGPCEDLRSS